MIDRPAFPRTLVQGAPLRFARRAVLVAAGCLALVASGCSGGTSSGTSAGGSGGTVGGSGGSDGWTRVTDQHLTFEHPSDWTSQPPSGEKWTHRFVGDGMEMQVSGLFSEDVTASGALSRLDLTAMVGLEQYDGGGKTFIEVDGADSALRSDFTFSDGGKARRGVWLLAGQFPYPATGAISITGEQLDPEVVSHVADTLTFNRKQGE